MNLKRNGLIVSLLLLSTALFASPASLYKFAGDGMDGMYMYDFMQNGTDGMTNRVIAESINDVARVLLQLHILTEEEFLLVWKNRLGATTADMDTYMMRSYILGYMQAGVLLAGRGSYGTGNR